MVMDLSDWWTPPSKVSSLVGSIEEASFVQIYA
jgi:hypothetical protein